MYLGLQISPNLPGLKPEQLNSPDLTVMAAQSATFHYLELGRLGRGEVVK